MANRQMIREWLDEGKAKGATHIVVVSDDFDHEYYPAFVMPGHSVRDKVDHFSGKNMQRVMEVYWLGGDLEEQLSRHRCHEYGPTPATGGVKITGGPPLPVEADEIRLADMRVGEVRTAVAPEPLPAPPGVPRHMVCAPGGQIWFVDTHNHAYRSIDGETVVVLGGDTRVVQPSELDLLQCAALAGRLSKEERRTAKLEAVAEAAQAYVVATLARAEVAHKSDGHTGRTRRFVDQNLVDRRKQLVAAVAALDAPEGA